MSPAVNNANAVSPTFTGPTYNPGLFPAYNDPFSPEAIIAADRRARRRFVTALGLGFLTYVLCGVIIGLAGGQGWWDNDSINGSWPGKLVRSPSMDGNTTECVNFLKSLPSSSIELPRRRLDTQAQPKANAAEHRPDKTNVYYKSKTYLHLPLTTTDGLFILGYGRYAVGPVKFVVEEPQDSHRLAWDRSKPSVEVEVVAVWNDKELLSSTKVCAMQRAGTLPRDTPYIERGVGIYTPQPAYPDQHRQVSFETVVRFPPSALHELQSLAVRGAGLSPVEIAIPHTQFDRIDLNTSLGPVTVPSSHLLMARELKVRTENGQIDGTFNVSELLDLTTSNGAIRARVNLQKPGRSDFEDVHVAAQTSNGYIVMEYPSHPYGVVLNSSLRSSNGDVSARMGSAFEGGFAMHTSWGRSSVRFDEKAMDPSGRKRERVLNVSKDDRNMGVISKEGSVYWKPIEKSAKGVSTIETTLGAVSMDFA